MSEVEPVTPPADSGESAPPVRRLRRFFLRHLPLSVGGTLGVLAVALFALYLAASSAYFENYVRRRIVAGLESATGARVEISTFHWHLLDLDAEMGGLVLHGLEAPGEAPLARVEQVRIEISLLNLWSRSFRLRNLEVTRPEIHLIVYPGGATNLPNPRPATKKSKPAVEQLFDLKAGRITLRQGALHDEIRATAFDFQDRFLPLDLDASDFALRMNYLPATGHTAERYQVEAGAGNLSLQRGQARNSSAKPSPPVESYFQATLELSRSKAALRSLRITTKGRGIKDRSLILSGELSDYSRPRWKARAVGELDLRLLDPITGYPFAPEGIAHLDLNGAGAEGQFRADGTVHVEGGSYIGTGVVATGVRLDARVHADPEQLMITSIVARLRQGGQIDGSVALEHWLTTLPGTAQMRPASDSQSHSAPLPPVLPADAITIPVNGKVIANFKDVAVDTVMDLVGPVAFQRLGIDARVNGPATAIWINGDVNTLSVVSLLHLLPSAQPVSGEAPATGVVDGTYTQRDGAVDLRKLEVHLPSSQLLAQGHLGAYPLTSSTGVEVDFHSGNLAEFDTVLTDLGLTRNGKSGSQALPGKLSGQADFHGTWAGSLLDPHFAGTARATQLTIEIPSASKAKPALVTSWDSIEATGSYSAARIAVDHGLLRHGPSEIALDGSLTAAIAGKAAEPEFNANSLLHLRMSVSKAAMSDLLPLLDLDLPVSGTVGAQIQVDGPVRDLGGSGWAQLDSGSLYGEPVERLRTQGTLAADSLKLASITFKNPAGALTASGSYDLKTRHFQAEARGTGLDLSRIEWLSKQNLSVTGKASLDAQGSGTIEDPRLEAHATLAGVALSGEALGSLSLQAHAANRMANYEITSNLEAAEVTAQGQTALSGDYQTQARIDFSHFNVGTLLKMAHIKGLSGDSAMVGSVFVTGPLARPEALRGEARLQQIAATVSGVHLQSEGAVHATLANNRIQLDPIHITGDQTDLRAQGTLSLKDRQQLDFSSNGSVNLKLAETLDPDLTASGSTTFQLEAHGPLANPGLNGRVDFKDGALSLEDLPNGLSQIRGTLEFNQSRLEVKSLTAMTGGGLLTLAGSLSWQKGLVADLTATGSSIRIRYPEGVSSLADATLHLKGAANNLLLSGDVLITRFTISPDLDLAALAAQSNTVETIASPDAPSNHVRLDVHVLSSPQLNFQNSYAKLAGDVDLRLRGTLAAPSLLGRISITEGSAAIAGTRYELQRGEISFSNPVRIEPNIDLNASAHVEDYDITLGLHGTPHKLAVSYRSDPPLPEADVVALLALGRTQNQQRLYTRQQEQSGASPTTDALLGGALNATVSSRVQKLFGAGSVKVDPNYLGALGNSTSRIIVEEQLGSNVSLTYATNVNTTAQQLIQAEVAINHHVSLLVARDESGVFSMVLKATRRFR